MEDLERWNESAVTAVENENMSSGVGSERQNMMVERILNEEQFTTCCGMCVFPVEKNKVWE